jgi:hypothetical protein
MNKLLFSAALLIALYGCNTVPSRGQGQYDIIHVTTKQGEEVDCDLEGTAKHNHKEYELNPKKNRYDIPKETDYDRQLTLHDLASPSATRGHFTEGKAVEIEGYVLAVTPGGTESCNCKTSDVKDRDTHIELIPDPSQSTSHSIVIVEMTPRMRLVEKDKDWSTHALKKSIEGKRIRVQGWLLYDVDHELENWADDPDDARGRENWRASCWEVHPVTNITILD